MNKAEELAAFGLKQSDFEASTIKDVVAAAEQFERVLNSVNACVQVELVTLTSSEIGAPDRYAYQIFVKAIDQVYP